MAGFFLRVLNRKSEEPAGSANSSGWRASRGRVRHRIERSGGGALAGARASTRGRKCIANDRLDDEPIGRRRQSKTNTEVHAEYAEFEISHGEQRMLLIGELREVPDLAKVGIIFKPHEQIRTELSRETCRRGKIRLAILPMPMSTIGLMMNS